MNCIQMSQQLDQPLSLGMLSQQLQQQRNSEPKCCALLGKRFLKGGKKEGRWNFLRSLSRILQNKNVKRLLESEIVWLALPRRGMISLMIKEALADVYICDGGGRWWRGDISILIENSPQQECPCMLGRQCEMKSIARMSPLRFRMGKEVSDPSITLAYS